MTLLFAGLVLFDAWLDGSLDPNHGPLGLQAHLLCAMILILTIPAILELAKLARTRDTHIFLPIAIPVTLVIETLCYWMQYGYLQSYGLLIVLYVLCISVLSSFILQAWLFGTQNVLKNCSATVFSIL